VNVFVCVTLNANNSADFFDVLPPTLEDYTSQGKRLPRPEFENLLPLTAQQQTLAQIERDNTEATLRSIRRETLAHVETLFSNF